MACFHVPPAHQNRFLSLRQIITHQNLRSLAIEQCSSAQPRSPVDYAFKKSAA